MAKLMAIDMVTPFVSDRMLTIGVLNAKPFNDHLQILAVIVLQLHKLGCLQQEAIQWKRRHLVQGCHTFVHKMLRHK